MRAWEGEGDAAGQLESQQTGGQLKAKGVKGEAVTPEMTFVPQLT